MRGQGLSLNTVVIAALVIIVLIILAVMVTQRSTLFGRQLSNISSQQCEDVGVVRPIGYQPCDVIYGPFDLPPGYQCCAKRNDSS